MSQKISLNRLWQSAPQAEQFFQPADLLHLPDNVVRRYLKHAIASQEMAIAPKTTLATAVRLKMHGEIKLKGWRWFRAEQVICYRRGMIWQATVRMNGLPIIGWDRLVEGQGAMQWKLLGLLPVMQAQGSDITRSAIGRMQGEYVWLPSALLDTAVQWQALDDTHACAELTLLGETTPLHLSIGETGQLQQGCFKRWGDPEGKGFRYENFGVIVEKEGTFSGYTIPTELRAGWYFGSDRFESEGEFFRATIDEAVYQ
ncbi:MAG: hypothetical protein HC800_11735 [Phormidesmis sp. RL_2_1]|nr:hypothetical protein [Phormidesmis sp. RL_2_1]